MKDVAIFYNSNNGQAHECAAAFYEAFEDHILTMIDPLTFRDPSILKKVKALITFGGDGLILRASNMLASYGYEVPMIRVDFGKVGFLSNVDPEHLEIRFAQFLKGGYTVTRKNRLSAIINDKHLLALNDIVIERHTPRVASFSLSAGSKTHQIKGDGVIIATKTGCTAYNRNARGLLVSDEDDLVMTFICSDPEEEHSYKLSVDTEISIRNVKRGNLRIVADGQEWLPIKETDSIIIKRCPISTLFLEFGD